MVSFVKTMSEFYSRLICVKTLKSKHVKPISQALDVLLMYIYYGILKGRAFGMREREMVHERF
jgi:hypothetical protein